MPVLGTSLETDRPVSLDDQARLQGTYVIGITGTGKTTLLLNLILADVAAGDGVCVLDPHGDLTEDLLLRLPPERVGDVILFDPADVDYPMGLNLFECADITDPRLLDRVCSEIIGTFYKLYAYTWGPHLEDLLRNAVLTLLVSPGATLLDLLLLLTNANARDYFTAFVTDPVVATYWRDRFPQNQKQIPDWVASTLNKVSRFLSNPLIRNIVAQPRSSFDLRAIMDEGKILLVNLSKGRIGEDNSSLLGSVLVSKILIAALSRAELPPSQRRRFHLVVDEYQSFATESFPTLQSEARKYNIDTVVAHQYRDQLDDLNRGSTLNVGNFLVFRVSGKDAFELASQFDNTPPPAERKMEPVYRRFGGEEGLFMTGEARLYHEVEGPRRLYSDVEREMANRLTNLPNWEAICKLIEGRKLVEHHIITDLGEAPPREEGMRLIRERSCRLAQPRAVVEQAIAARIAEVTGEQTLDFVQRH